MEGANRGKWEAHGWKWRMRGSGRVSEMDGCPQFLARCYNWLFPKENQFDRGPSLAVGPISHCVSGSGTSKPGSQFLSLGDSFSALLQFLQCCLAEQ